MNDAELDWRLGELLREQDAPADEAFVDRTVAAARIDADMRRARKTAWHRALIDCAGAVAVASTFFLLSQAQAPSPDGIIPLNDPAMAGLIMLGLWAAIALPTSAGRTGRA